MRRLNYAFVKRPLLLSCMDLLYFMLVLVFSDLVSLAFLLFSHEMPMEDCHHPAGLAGGTNAQVCQIYKWRMRQHRILKQMHLLNISNEFKSQ